MTLSTVSLAKLQTDGWTSIPISDAWNDTVTVARSLGELMRTRKVGGFIDRLEPSQIAAHPHSLTASYGNGEFPLHQDGTHLPLPPRFIVLTCAELGQDERPTTLCDTSALEFDCHERNLLETAALLVKNGRNSFYATILDRTRNPPIRFDPGCMIAMDSRGALAMALFREAATARTTDFIWSTNSALVIDNHRMLHGRGSAAAPGTAARTLLRATIK